MKEFKKGDRVFTAYGYGIVSSLDEKTIYRVQIVLDDGDTMSCMLDGYEIEGHLYPTVFHADEIPEYYKQFIKDERIGKAGYFWDEDCLEYVVYSILEEINNNGKYKDSRKNIICYWDNFSLTPPELK